VTRILIIDDDPRLREATRAVLELEGFEVTLAHDGSQAAGVYRLQPAAVVLCDMYMPGKEGIETIEELRREFPGVKIIAISGGGSSGKTDVLQLAQRLGAAGTLVKPFEKAALLAEIQRLLQQP
jgi:CheY-like chemotaxis protein